MLLFVFVNFSLPDKCDFIEKINEQLYLSYECLSHELLRSSNLKKNSRWMRALYQPVWAFIRDLMGGVCQLDVINQFANPKLET